MVYSPKAGTKRQQSGRGLVRLLDHASITQPVALAYGLQPGLRMTIAATAIFVVKSYKMTDLDPEALDERVSRALAIAVTKGEHAFSLRNWSVEEPIEVWLSPRAVERLGLSLPRLNGGKVNGYEIRLAEEPPSSGADVEVIMVAQANDDVTNGFCIGEALPED